MKYRKLGWWLLYGGGSCGCVGGDEWGKERKREKKEKKGKKESKLKIFKNVLKN